MRFNRSASLVLLGSVLLGSASPSLAAPGLNLVVEPYAGWALAGKTNLSAIPSNTDQGSFSGLGLGARGGVGILGVVFAGLDFTFLPSLNVGPTSDSYYDSGAKVTRLGGVLGVNIPVVPFRFWLGYNFLEKLSDTPEITRGTPAGADVGLDGHSIKVGIGFTGIPFVSLNVEYIFAKYDTMTLNGLASPFPLGADGVTAQALFFSASVPLSSGF